MSFALLAILLPLALFEKFSQQPSQTQNFETKVQPDFLAGFFLTVVKGRPINPITERIFPNRDIHFFFSSENENKPTHLKWYANDSLLFIQKCPRTDYCSGIIEPRRLPKQSLLSVDVLHKGQLLVTRSLEIDSVDFSKLPQ